MGRSETEKSMDHAPEAPHGILSSRTLNTAKKEEREEALKNLLQKQKAKHKMRRGFGIENEDVEEVGRPVIGQRSNSPSSGEDGHRHRPVMSKNDAVSAAEQAPSQNPFQRRLKKLSECGKSSRDAENRSEDIVLIEDDSPKQDPHLEVEPTSSKEWRKKREQLGAADIAGRLGGLSINKAVQSSARQSNKLTEVLEASRQQALPDDDDFVPQQQKKQWTDWPEPSAPGQSRKPAYGNLKKINKTIPSPAFVDLEEEPGSPDAETAHGGRSAVSGAGKKVMEAGRKGHEKSKASSNCAFPVPRSKERNQTKGAQGLVLDEEASTSGTQKQSEEARAARAAERIAAVLAKDKDALVLGRGRYCLPGRIAKQLYPHQRESIEWLWSLHVKKTGGILGDDMGLGKTMQIASYVSGLFHSRLIRCVLVVAPKTLLAQWELELTQKCGLGHKVLSYHEGSPNERAWNLRHTLQQGGILLTTYGMIQHNAIPLAGLDPEIGKDGYGEMADDMVTWDYVVLDEGHQIKNEKTVKAKNLRSILARHRLIVSGTPVQNNLQEMWSLFDFCCPGLLGDSRYFKEEYERKITNGQNRDATERARHVGVVTSQKLRAVIAPFFLRREKKDVIKTPKPGAAADAQTPASGAAPAQRQMDMSARKNDLIVWLKPTPEQKRLYVSFLQSEQVKKVFNEKRSALAALTVLKKICDHPLLLTERAASEIARGASRAAAHSAGGAAADLGADELTEGDAAAAADLALEIARARGIALGEGSHAAEPSCKVLFLMELLEDLVWSGHRTLVFSQSKKMLDIIQVEVVARNFRFCRIDGGIVSAKERQKLVEEFQTVPDIPVFLLTSQVGGLGLTLTAADRVVIIDPAWNPSVDNQSVDRAYRIGQRRDVVVYRLITSGTIEEKIYCKQVFKGGLMRAVTEHKDYKKMFNENELTALFSIPERGFEFSETMERLHVSQAGQVDSTPDLDQHIAHLETRGIVGVSHHDLLFKEAAEDVPIVATVDSSVPYATSAPARRQVVDLTSRGSRKAALPTARVERINLLAEAQAFLDSNGASDSRARFAGSGGNFAGFKGFGSSSATPWTVPDEESALERKAAEAESAARKRVEDLAQELKKAEWLLKSQAQSLPDKGEKIEQKIQRLSDQLQEAQVAATKPLSPEVQAVRKPDATAAAAKPLTPQTPALSTQITSTTAESVKPHRTSDLKEATLSKLEASNPPTLEAPKVATRPAVQFSNLGTPSAPSVAKRPGESISGLPPGLPNQTGPGVTAFGGHVSAPESFVGPNRISEVGTGSREPSSSGVYIAEPKDYSSSSESLSGLSTESSSESDSFESSRSGDETGDSSYLIAKAGEGPGVPSGGSAGTLVQEELLVKSDEASSAALGEETKASLSLKHGDSNLEEAKGANSGQLFRDGQAHMVASEKPSAPRLAGTEETREFEQRGGMGTPSRLGGPPFMGSIGSTRKEPTKPEPLSGFVSSPVVTRVDGIERGVGPFNTGAFGTPIRNAATPGQPRSELKLRASLRKKRAEKGDSPPGGMPSFDLGLDDLDDVADKLESLSVA